jgi:hypothetical protein
VIGYALFLRITLIPQYAAVTLPSMLLLGAACALAFPSLNIQATNGVADHEQGMVSGLLNTSIQVGGAVFLAVVTAVITAGGRGGRVPAAGTRQFPARPDRRHGDRPRGAADHPRRSAPPPRAAAHHPGREVRPRGGRGGAGLGRRLSRDV